MRTKLITIKDLIAIICCLFFLLINLGAIGRAGRSRAKEAICKANLQKWGLAFQLYVDDYEGYNPYGNWAHSWWHQMLPYASPDANDRKIFLCPMATKTSSEGADHPFRAWDYGSAPQQYGGKRYRGSYGVNPWIFSFEGSSGSRFGGFDPEEWRWKRPDVAVADNVPVFGDCSITGNAPTHTDLPPYFRDSEPKSNGGDRDGMGYWCLDRHDCHINLLFMDWSVRKTKLKCLWKLKWHRQFDTTQGPSEKGKSIADGGWPEWMTGCPQCE
jgi:hypothetical protein